MRGGLRKERASEIRTILEAKDVAREFIAQPEPGAKRLGVKAALRKARARGAPKTPDGQTKAAGARSPHDTLSEISRSLDRLVFLLEKNRTCSLEGDEFLFRYTPISRRAGGRQDVPPS